MLSKSADKYHAHESKRLSRSRIVWVAVAVSAALGITLIALLANGGGGQKSSTIPPERPTTLSEAKRYSNCTEFDGAVSAVKQVAEGEGYLHNFEYDRLHPCCLVKNTGAAPGAISADDIVFVVMTSSKTPQKAKAVIETWGAGLENLFMISDTADPDLPPGTITPGAPAYDRSSAGGGGGSGSGNGHGHSGGRGGSGSSGGNSGSSGVGASLRAAMDEQHTPIWAVKYLSMNPEFAARLQGKRWFMVADDDTWVNVPALIDFVSRYDPRCPVVFGYVWSKLWSDKDSDYHSGGAGLLMSSHAFWEIAPAFYTSECPFHHYNDITFGRCAWKKAVQLVHHRGFYYDPPERSKDRHETVWLPPIAEALTYHYIGPTEMQLMTNYANQRWQYVPGKRGNFSTFLSVSPSRMRNTDWDALSKKYTNK